MKITTLSSQQFAQDALMAIHATDIGPVFIEDCDTSTHVLLSFQNYQDLLMQRRNIAASLAAPDTADVEFEPPRSTIQLKKIDFK
jgi:hypothetical protein